MYEVQFEVGEHNTDILIDRTPVGSDGAQKILVYDGSSWAPGDEYATEPLVASFYAVEKWSDEQVALEALDRMI